jgi:hypothetical protein
MIYTQVVPASHLTPACHPPCPPRSWPFPRTTQWPWPTDTPLTVIADKTFHEVPDPAVVLVPGGGAPTIKAMGIR